MSNYKHGKVLMCKQIKHKKKDKILVIYIPKEVL